MTLLPVYLFMYPLQKIIPKYKHKLSVKLMFFREILMFKKHRFYDYFVTNLTANILRLCLVEILFN